MSEEEKTDPQGWLEEVRKLPNEYLAPFSLQALDGAIVAYERQSGSHFNFDRKQISSGYIRYDVLISFLLRGHIGIPYVKPPLHRVGWYQARTVGENKTYLRYTVARSPIPLPQDVAKWDAIQHLAAFVLVHLINWTEIELERIKNLAPAPFFKEAEALLQEMKVMTGDFGPHRPSTPPPVTDPTDQRILAWVTEDPDLTDQEIAQRLDISRTAVNPRRRRLGLMGYKVR